MPKGYIVVEGVNGEFTIRELTYTKKVVNDNTYYFEGKVQLVVPVFPTRRKAKTAARKTITRLIITLQNEIKRIEAFRQKLFNHPLYRQKPAKRK